MTTSSPGLDQRARRGGAIDDAELQPDGAGADRDHLVDVDPRFRRPAEDVDDVDPDVAGDVVQRSVRALAVDLGRGRVHRDHPLALGPQQPGDAVAVAPRVGRAADDGPRLVVGQQDADRLLHPRQRSLPGPMKLVTPTDAGLAMEPA